MVWGVEDLGSVGAGLRARDPGFAGAGSSLSSSLKPDSPLYLDSALTDLAVINPGTFPSVLPHVVLNAPCHVV